MTKRLNDSATKKKSLKWSLWSFEVFNAIYLESLANETFRVAEPKLFQLRLQHSLHASQQQGA